MTEGFSLLFVTQQQGDLVGERSGIVGIDELAGLPGADHVGNAAHVAGDRRQPDPLGEHQRAPHTLVAGRLYVDIEASQELLDRLLGAHKTHRFISADLGAQRPQLVVLPTIAPDEDLERR